MRSGSVLTQVRGQFIGFTFWPGTSSCPPSDSLINSKRSLVDLFVRRSVAPDLRVEYCVPGTPADLSVRGSEAPSHGVKYCVPGTPCPRNSRIKACSSIVS